MYERVRVQNATQQMKKNKKTTMKKRYACHTSAPEVVTGAKKLVMRIDVTGLLGVVRCVLQACIMPSVIG